MAPFFYKYFEMCASPRNVKPGPSVNRFSIRDNISRIVHGRLLRRGEPRRQESNVGSRREKGGNPIGSIDIIDDKVVSPNYFCSSSSLLIDMRHTYVEAVCAGGHVPRRDRRQRGGAVARELGAYRHEAHCRRIRSQNQDEEGRPRL